MKTTQPMDLERAPWLKLKEIEPLDAIRLHPRRAEQPLDPGASKMGWPFLWPADEPWPVCQQKASPETLREHEKMLGQMGVGISIPGPAAPGLNMQFVLESFGIEQGSHIHNTYVDVTRRLIDEGRNGHQAPYLPVLQLRRDDFPSLPFPDDTDLFQLLWCPRIHFCGGMGEEASGHLVYWRRSHSLRELRETPPKRKDDTGLKTCMFDPEPIQDYPNVNELDADAPEDLSDEESIEASSN